MKRFNRNFKKLSVKQIRTYAAIIIFSTISFNALASGKDEMISFEEELALENWMMSSFETGIEEELALENWMLTSFETGIEEELALENWMTAPFESDDHNIEVIYIENSRCVPMP
ncbi:MAG: hypothetical protein R6W31_03650 [Bacteroidales bacterium]